MRVLVTGATGMIGRATLELLAAESIPSTALVLEEPDEPVPATEVVVGDARDVEAVARALRDCDALIHLAAIPSPLVDPPEEVFGVNTLATFTVLDQAGQVGVTRCAIASSYAICGLPFAPRPLSMPYLPVDTRMPLQVTDAYALSKRVDEATAEMIAVRYGMDVVALRLPFVGTADDRLPARAADLAEHPELGTADVWSYLDARDAARALLASLTATQSGMHALYLAAEETLAPYRTEWLLDRFHPGVPRPVFAGRTTPIDLAPARDLIGFTAAYPMPVDEIEEP
jgi:nucleoside-diphosphate-sugar epimerase